MKTTKKLYGVDVPRLIYKDVKLVADVLARQTTTRVKLAEARKAAAEVALAVFDLFRSTFS